MNTILLCLVLCFVSGMSAQSYTFNLEQAEYTEFTDGLSVNDGEVWDDPGYGIDLGFTFPLFSTPLDSLYFDAWDGYGGDLTTRLVREEDDETQPRHLILAYLSDLADRGSGTSISESPITYHLTGTEPNRVGILQWKNAGFYDDIDEDNVSDHFVNFQLWFYEGTGRMEVHYGPSSEAVRNGAEGTQPAFILVKDYVNDDQGDIYYDEAYYLSGPADNPIFASIDELGEDEEPYLDGTPAPGTVYVFTVAESNGTRNPDNLAAPFFQVYPNPATTDVHLMVAAEVAGRVTQLEVFDAIGRRLAVYAELPTVLPLATYPAGAYHLRLTTDSGGIAQQRVLKR